MKKTIFCLIVLALLALNNTLPVTQKKKEDKEEKSNQETPDVETALEYERYLKEVVEALESDPDFRKKLDKAPEADIRSGKIALELDYVNHHVRTKLDEIKRRELERLRSLANKEYELSNDIDREHLKVPQHLDHANEHSFEIEDLRKLIKKTSEDLAEADRKRRAEFKEYEMQKEFEHEMAMKEMTEEQRKQFQHEMEEQKEKHNKHEKVHQPGNKAQLEEVWEKQDHMDRQDFNPKTFFMIHDVDGNGFWDETEVKALFVKELDKVYQSGLAEDDMRERAEEMERMREHVFQETDTNHDGLISFQEFLDQTKREEFNKDPEWETVDQQPQYTHEEYLEFERRRKEEIDKMIAQGLLPPHPNMPQGYYTTAGGAYQHPAGYQQQQQHQPQHPQMHYQNQQQQYMQQQQHYQQQQYQQQQQQQHYPQQQQQHYPQQQQQPHQQQQQQQQPIYQTHHEQPVQLHPNQVYQHVPPLPQSPGNTIHESHPQPLVVEKMPIQQQQQQQQQQQPVESQAPKQQQPQTPIQSPVMNNHNHKAQQKQQNLINNNNNNIPQHQPQPHKETIPIKH